MHRANPRSTESPHRRSQPDQSVRAHTAGIVKSSCSSGYVPETLNGLIDKLTNAILRLVGKGQASTDFTFKEICHQSGDYVVIRLLIARQSSIADLKIKDTGFQERDVTFLAIERGSGILSHPEPEERLLAGDCLLCYGKLADIETLASRKTT